MKLLLTITFAFICLVSCRTYTRWTEKQKAEFADKCSKTDTANGLNFSLTGFTYDEIENVLIRQIHKGQTVDSFYVHPTKDSFDSLRTRYLAYIDKPLYIKDTFAFIVKGYKPFILTDMKMIMWAQFTMFSEGYGCVMGDYKINGNRFDHSANPDFVKEGFKFSWQ
jgi:hypothetical protein